MKKILLALCFLFIVTGVSNAQYTATKIQGKSGGTATVTNDKLDTNSTQASGVNFDVEGVVAEGAADSANPISTGMKAESTVPTEVDDGDIVKPWADTFGRQTLRSYNLSTGAESVEVISPVPMTAVTVSAGSATLDDSPTSLTSNTVAVGSLRNVGALVKCDETDSGDDTETAITVDLSDDGTTWFDAAFYVAGDTTPVSSATICDSGDENVALSLVGPTAKYMRVILTCTGCAAGGDDQEAVVIYITGQQ